MLKRELLAPMRLATISASMSCIRRKQSSLMNSIEVIGLGQLSGALMGSIWPWQLRIMALPLLKLQLPLPYGGLFMTNELGK